MHSTKFTEGKITEERHKQNRKRRYSPRGKDKRIPRREIIHRRAIPTDPPNLCTPITIPKDTTEDTTGDRDQKGKKSIRGQGEPHTEVTMNRLIPTPTCEP